MLLYNKGSKQENTQPEFSLLSAPSKQSARQHLILGDTLFFNWSPGGASFVQTFIRRAEQPEKCSQFEGIPAITGVNWTGFLKGKGCISCGIAEAIDVNFKFGCKGSCKYRCMKWLNAFPYLPSSWFSKSLIVKTVTSQKELIYLLTKYSL